MAEKVALADHTKRLQAAYRRMVVAPLPLQAAKAICQHAGLDLGSAGAGFNCQLREAKPAVPAPRTGQLVR